MQNSGNNSDNQGMNSMYSELYNKIKPYINSIADRLRNAEVDDEMMDSIVLEILERIGMPQNSMNMMDSMDNNLCPMGICPNDMDMMFDDFDDFDDDDVIPAIRMMGSNRQRRRRPRQQHPRRRRPSNFPIFPVYPISPNSPEDFVRWLLWREVWGI